MSAGRLNQLRRLASTPEQRERYREAALKTKPWLRATGPKTEAGKAKSAANNQSRQCCQPEAKLLREDKAEAALVIKVLRALRNGL